MGTKHSDNNKMTIFCQRCKKISGVFSKITVNYIVGNRLIFLPKNGLVPFFSLLVGHGWSPKCLKGGGVQPFNPHVPTCAFLVLIVKFLNHTGV